MTSRELPSGLTAPERETVILMDDGAEVVTICTSQPPVARKLLKAGVPLVSEATSKGHVVSLTFSAPKRYFRWSVRPPRKLTEAQKAKQVAALAKAREGTP